MRDLIFLFFLFFGREIFYHFVKHIPHTQLAGCGDRNRITDTKVIELVYIRHEFCKAVYFIHHQKYRFATSSQHISHFGIGIYQSLTHIGDENNNICGINRDLRLISHLCQDNILTLRLNTTGIDQCKTVI